MSARVRGTLRRAVIERAVGCCEYCGMPDDVLRLPHEPDHIIATQHGGLTVFENLAYTCFRCNRYKGPNLASVDPESGALTPLFNPRVDVWQEHFFWDSAKILAQTPVGRATSALLRFNEPERVQLRTNLIQQGHYPLRHP